MGEFTGRVALVTGGTAGIGAAVARAMAVRGAHVVVSGRNADRAEAVVAGIRCDGGSAEFVAADVTSTAEVKALIDRTTAASGRLDYAVNSAGVFDHGRTFHDYDDSSWDTMMATNLTGVFRCMRAEIDAMLSTGGAIVNVASTVGHRGSRRASPAYVAAKHAVVGLTRQAALEYADQGLRINSVSPGPTLTDMAASLVAQGPDVVKQVLAPLNPMGVFITPEQVAAAVVYLCSDAATCVNGTDLALDGGQLARL